MIIIDEKDMAALRSLMVEARTVWETARLFRMQGVDLTRSDMAMQRLHEALNRAEAVAFVPMSGEEADKKPASKTKAKTRR